MKNSDEKNSDIQGLRGFSSRGERFLGGKISNSSVSNLSGNEVNVRDFERGGNRSGRLLTSERNAYYSQREELAFSARHLRVRFGRNVVLDNVNFDLKIGEFVFITGETGAGKTTLLNVLGGAIRYFSGQVNFPNDSIHISRVFQDLKLFESLTVKDNLELCFDPSVYQSKDDFLQDANDLLISLHLSGSLNKKVSSLSGGGQQKIAIIRSLLSRPDIILADEPTSSLDFKSSQKVYDVFNYYCRKRGTTVIWATHDLSLIQSFNRRVLHLENGRVVKR